MRTRAEESDAGFTESSLVTQSALSPKNRAKGIVLGVKPILTAEAAQSADGLAVNRTARTVTTSGSQPLVPAVPEEDGNQGTGVNNYLRTRREEADDGPPTTSYFPTRLPRSSASDARPADIIYNIAEVSLENKNAGALSMAGLNRKISSAHSATGTPTRADLIAAVNQLREKKAEGFASVARRQGAFLFFDKTRATLVGLEGETLSQLTPQADGGPVLTPKDFRSWLTSQAITSVGAGQKVITNPERRVVEQSVVTESSLLTQYTPDSTKGVRGVVVGVKPGLSTSPASSTGNSADGSVERTVTASGSQPLVPAVPKEDGNQGTGVNDYLRTRPEEADDGPADYATTVAAFLNMTPADIQRWQEENGVEISDAEDLAISDEEDFDHAADAYAHPERIYGRPDLARQAGATTPAARALAVTSPAPSAPATTRR